MTGFNKNTIFLHGLQVKSKNNRETNGNNNRHEPKFWELRGNKRRKEKRTPVSHDYEKDNMETLLAQFGA